MERPTTSDAKCCLSGPLLCASHSEALSAVFKYVVTRFSDDTEHLIEVADEMLTESQTEQVVSAIDTFIPTLNAAMPFIGLNNLIGALASIFGDDTERFIEKYFDEANDDECVEAWYVIDEVA